MKRILDVFLLCAVMLCFTACGDVSAVRVIPCESEIYSDEDISSAINTAIDYFKKEFDGCKLNEITYIGDDKLDGYQEFAQRHQAQDVIVLVSSFDVDESGGDGSLNPNSTYNNWKWILVRNPDESWRHADHGYG